MPSSKPTIGVDDLKSQLPELAKEAFGWDPSTVKCGSTKRKAWACALGHVWETEVRNRAVKGSSCPFCAGVKVLTGFNDLKTSHPRVAIEADGWDPSTVTRGSTKKMPWKCSLGHTWEASVNTRTNAWHAQGCPYCAGKRAWKGFNDLATHFPDLAKEADGWDPAALTTGSSKKVSWKCRLGHKWGATIASRTGQGSGCPVCAGKDVLQGFNDLATLFPEVAADADGWDPATLTSGSKKRMPWKCQLGHRWHTAVFERTALRGSTGCPVCANRQVLSGFNDLKTVDPELAKEACGWDPSQVLAGSHSKLQWMCRLGHTWSAAPKSRRPPASTGCPYCSYQLVLAGFNDLQTTHPELAKEADGWDPTEVIGGSNKKVAWKCIKCGNKWSTQPLARTRPDGTGCPECADSGFKKELPSWFYLLERPGEQQIGITNNLGQRLRTHKLNGWSKVDAVGPFPGALVLATETLFKKWLRAEVGLVPQTHENWFTSALEVGSLSELKAKSGLETELF